MTYARQRSVNETGMATRRTAQRQFLLKPCTEVNQTLGYLLGAMQEKYQQSIHCFVAMSTHIHSHMSDNSDKIPFIRASGVVCSGEEATHSNTPAFMRDFLAFSARGLNQVWHRRENLWAGGGARYNYVATPGDTESQIERMVYVLMNPVVAELVAKREQWPGLLLDPGPTGERIYTFKRPKLRITQGMPEVVHLRVTAPDVPDMTREEFMAEVYLRCELATGQIQEKVQSEGRRFLGAIAVREAKHTDHAKSKEKRYEAIPLFAASTQAGIKALYKQNDFFLLEHQTALSQVRKQEYSDIVFPHGTHRAVEWYGFSSLLPRHRSLVSENEVLPALPPRSPLPP